jgi:hypothetical protein
MTVMTMLTERQDEGKLLKLLNQAKIILLDQAYSITHYRLAVRVTIKQDRQRKYNVILRRFRATIIAVENQYLLPMVRLCL